MFIAPRRADAIAELAMRTFDARYGGLGALSSPDLAALARVLSRHRPTLGELLSYLLFDREFIDALIEMGAADANAWLNSPPGPNEPWQLEPLDAFGPRVRVAPARRSAAREA